MKRVIIKGPGYCAVTEDGLLTEYIREDTGDQYGAVLTGKIGRLMPGMKCAFVDIGRKRSGFLPMDDLSASFTGAEARSGDLLILQVKKEETGEKGAFLTRDVVLPGKLVILMPMNRYIGISNRIKEEAVRARLKQTGTETAGGRFGLIMRSAAAEAQDKEIREEAEALFVQWIQITERAKEGEKPGRVLYYGDTFTRLTEDYASGGFETAEETTGPGTDLLRQLKQAEARSVSLPGGGNIVIDRCEAMTVIDVNTSSYAGAGSKEQNVLHTNLEACEMIARQVRLRNLSGIILIDFIDMDEETDRSLVFDKLKEYFSHDRIKTVIHGWTNLGIMEMTRKRTGKGN